LQQADVIIIAAIVLIIVALILLLVIKNKSKHCITTENRLSGVSPEDENDDTIDLENRDHAPQRGALLTVTADITFVRTSERIS